MEMVAHHGIAADVDTEDSSELLKPQANPLFAVIVVFSGDRILAAEERSPCASNDAVVEGDAVIGDNLVAREGRFHERANQVVIRHHLRDVVCAIEVVSPRNKAGRIAIREFVTKAVDFLMRGINLLVVDPFPPGVQDPQTLHKLIWDEFDAGVPFALPADEPLLLASYRAAVPLVEFTPQAFRSEERRVGKECA